MEFIYIYIYTAIQTASTILWMAFWSFIIAGGVTLLFSFLGTGSLSYHKEDNDRHEELKTALLKLIKNKIVMSLFLLMLAITILVPSRKDLETIIAGGLIWKGSSALTEIDGIESLPENIVSAMNAFLERSSEDKK